VAIRVGVVGYGKMGSYHAREIPSQQRGFVIHSICDTSPGRLAAAKAELGCKTYSRLEEFLADKDLDLVVVATPSNAHVEPAIAALKAGKHVVVEKPMCTSYKDALRMAEAAKRARRVLVVYQNRRWDDYFLTTRKVVESGRLGRLYDIRFITWTWSRLMQTFGVKEFRPQWRSEAKFGGGVLLDFGPHYLDQLLLLVDSKVADVYCNLAGRRWTADADDQFQVTVRFENGVIATVEVSHNAIVPVDLRWVINGEKAGYKFENGQGWILTRTAKGDLRTRPVKAVPTNWAMFYKNLYRHLTKGEPPAVPLEQSLRLMKLIDAARKSACTGRVVAVNG